MGDKKVKDAELKEKLPLAWQQLWDEKGYQSPSYIQQVIYEPILQGKDVVGISPTGSGKTLAYLFPLLQQVKEGGGNQLLILLPSQELSVQVAKVAKEWAEAINLKVISLVGGANVNRQIDKLKEKPEVLVGTPGRVLELIKTKKIKTHLLKHLVLDEADQLLETNELNATNTIIKSVNRDTQLICVSATGSDVHEQFDQGNEKNWEVIDVTNEDTSKGIVQHGFISVPQRKRVDMLRRLSHVAGFKGIIFFNELKELGAVSKKLTYEGVPNSTLASDQNKMERRLALHGFEEGKVSLLLTTDIAARGLDFDALPYVIHYEIPFSEESYIHRSGRTGRMGNDGSVLTLIDDHQKKELKRLTNKFTEEITEFFVFSGMITPDEPHAHQQKVIKEEFKVPKKDKVDDSKVEVKLNQETKIPRETTRKESDSQKKTVRKKIKTKSKKNKGARKKKAPVKD